MVSSGGCVTATLNLWRRVAIVSLVLGVVGCAAMPQARIENLKRPRPEAHIVVMPLDVELSELSAGGLAEPNAAWTKAANAHMYTALRAETALRQARLIESEPDPAGGGMPSRQHQIVKLHQAVGTAMLVHGFVLPMALPTKNNKLDWTLGPAVSDLRDRYQADYALFIYVRDSYTSAGRAAVIFLGAMLGVAIPGGVQIGFASLVDLESGDIVWFNRLARPSGDLRTAEAARETVGVLLKGLPK
jgi:hypothetical protein